MTSHNDSASSGDEQIARQCEAVAALATALAECHTDFAKLVRSGATWTIHEIIGDRSAALMEYLGDTLNGMDAGVDDDDWMIPIFEEAQRRYPRNKG